jgi:predicted nuclease with TOPRIM domain
MRRKIPQKIKNKIIELWLRGESYRKISLETKVSLGAISEIINEKRKEFPELDELRELFMRLSREGSTVSDAMRGGALLDTLNELEISLREMDDYLVIFKTISDEARIETRNFIHSALKLHHLETENRPHEEVIKDYEEKLSSSMALESKKKQITLDLAALTEEQARLYDDLNQRKSELKQTIASRDRLAQLGIEKVNTLTKFINDYEAVKFSIDVIQRLASLQRALDEMNIGPTILQEYIDEHGSLRNQLKALKKKVKTTRTRHRKLNDNYQYLLEQYDYIDNNIHGLLRKYSVLKDKQFTFQCKHCEQIGLHGKIPTLKSIIDAREQGFPASIKCTFCNKYSLFTPSELYAKIAELIWIELLDTKVID